MWSTLVILCYLVICFGSGWKHRLFSKSEDSLLSIMVQVRLSLSILYELAEQSHIASNSLGLIWSLYKKIMCMQYVANPYLPGVLKDVNFILSLPFSPISLKMSPRCAPQLQFVVDSWSYLLCLFFVVGVFWQVYKYRLRCPGLKSLNNLWSPKES